MNWSANCAHCYGGRIFSYLAAPKPDLGQYGVARNFAKLLKKKMTVFLTVFLAATAENRLWILACDAIQQYRALLRADAELRGVKEQSI